MREKLISKTYLRDVNRYKLEIYYDKEDYYLSIKKILNIEKSEYLKSGIKKEVIDFVLWDLIDKETIIHINPTWIFQIGWPKWDCWLTGRKIIVDTYGWIWRHWWCHCRCR